ncbi:hypothetical protein HBB16_18915 [Pseudonocardia sp. MCCB 268]|nr:hypothetical protein [Pseudonocardia cytotoxica]
MRLTERCLHSAAHGREVDQARQVAIGVLDEGVRLGAGGAGADLGQRRRRNHDLSGIAQDLPRYDPEQVHLSTLCPHRAAPGRRP